MVPPKHRHPSRKLHANTKPGICDMDGWWPPWMEAGNGGRRTQRTVHPNREMLSITEFGNALPHRSHRTMHVWDPPGCSRALRQQASWSGRDIQGAVGRAEILWRGIMGGYSPRNCVSSSVYIPRVTGIHQAVKQSWNVAQLSTVPKISEKKIN